MSEVKIEAKHLRPSAIAVTKRARKTPKQSGRKAARHTQAVCRYCGEVTDKAGLTELQQGFFIHEACKEEWRSDGN
jgi:hypothetical protein